jgi:rhodanese-related sulfurtransferase
MILALVGVVVVCTVIAGVVVVKRKQRREMDEYSIEPETLHELMKADKEVLVFDVRQPLDLLAHSEIIPGAKRVPPKEVLEQTSVIPKEKDAVIYCTCPSEKTSRVILRRARELNFSRIKFLRGGLAAWKAKGYPVELYTTPFRLDTAS